MPDTAYSYAYQRPSTLHEADGRLGLETSGGRALAEPSTHPRFFTGFLTNPGVAAAGLLAVARVARERYVLTNQLRGGPASADPVVTCNGDRLRFESFSACCGVYARLDVLSEALDGEVHDRGTTNVDVNEPLRRALARIGGEDPLHLAVGPDELAVTTVGGRAVEKKVPLPPRWLRGFAEAQVIMAACDPRAELDAVEAGRFLRSLPAGSAVGTAASDGSRVVSGHGRGAQWAVLSGRGLRLTSAPVPGAVCLAGAHRLGALAPLLRHVRRLRAYGPAVTSRSEPCSSAWEVELPGMRLVLALSPAANRGFSGEGSVLDSLSGGQGSDADLIGALLEFEPCVQVDLLAERSGLPPERVREALVRLGTAGWVGYDLAEAAYFHRELPYDATRAERDNPRLRDARALFAAGAVGLDGDVATVTVTDHVQRVRLAADGQAWCTCDWWARHHGTRGPCKHVLAARLARDAASAAGGVSAGPAADAGASRAASPAPETSPAADAGASPAAGPVTGAGRR
jgi:SWIM zinc finger